MLGGFVNVINGAKLTSIDNAICNNSKWDGIKFEANPAEENTLLVYPNPANTNFSILYNGKDIATVNYYIVDMLGKEIKKGLLQSFISQEINTANFTEGVYSVYLSKSDKVFKKQKLVVLKY